MQNALIRWAPKAPLDFRALIEEPTPLAAYSDLRMPVLVMRGKHAPRPTRKIAEMLASVMPKARLAVIDGAGHMGPSTHGSVVSKLIAAHTGAAEAAICRRRGGRSRLAAIAGCNSCVARRGHVVTYPPHAILRDVLQLPGGIRVVVRPALPQDKDYATGFRARSF